MTTDDDSKMKNSSSEGFFNVNRQVTKDRQEFLLKIRDIYQNIYNSQTIFLDKFILLFSGGALGLSLTILDSLSIKPYTRKFIVLSWIGYVSCIFITLLGYFLSREVHKKLIINVDNYLSYDEPKEDLFMEKLFSNSIMICNILSIITFTFSTILLLLFAFLNLII